MALTIPGITWRGIRSAATKELAIRVDAGMMNALKQPDPKMWWVPLVMSVPTDPGVEATRLPIDFEDLGEWEEDVGPSVAKGAKPLASILIPRKPWKKVRRIPTADLKRNGFAGWPDKLVALALSARRMEGVIVRDLIFQAATKVLTYQGITLIHASGHRCDPTDEASDTFGNLHTTNSNFDSAGWEGAQTTKFARLGPGGFGLDMDCNIVLGGTAMRPKFDRMFKRVITLDSDSNGAAGVTNIHATQVEGGTIAIVSSWLDKHPWKLANATKDHWWTISTTYPARPFGIVSEGAPEYAILDVGSEYEISNDEIFIKGKMAANGAGAFPHTIDEYRGT